MTMAEEESNLIPSASRDVFLLTIPPKSLFHDPHRCVQLQKIIHQSEQAGSRIRPIFNLEYHKMFATRVIELEDDDVKVAEFHPHKGHHEEAEAHVNHGGSIRRRKRTFSIENKNGALGGNISSQTRKLGLCDMTVTGSERVGQLIFTGSDGTSYEWQKLYLDGSAQWILDEVTRSTTDNQAMNGAHVNGTHGTDNLRTSYEFLRRPKTPPLARVGTSMTLTSQYTTHFENESQLSGMTSTPQVDPRDIVSCDKIEDIHKPKQPRAVLAAAPMPHLRIALAENPAPRHSMREITDQNEEVYRILLCTLWIVWSSPDFNFEPDAQQPNQGHSLDSQAEGLTLVDRHSKIGLSKNTSDQSPERRRQGSKDTSTNHRAHSPTSKNPDPTRKKSGIFSMIAKICGG